MKRLYSYLLNAIYIALTVAGVLILINDNQTWRSGVIISGGFIITLALLRRFPSTRVIRMELVPQILGNTIAAPIFARLTTSSIQPHELWTAVLFAALSLVVYCFGVPVPPAEE